MSEKVHGTTFERTMDPGGPLPLPYVTTSKHPVKTGDYLENLQRKQSHKRQVSERIVGSPLPLNYDTRSMSEPVDASVNNVVVLPTREEEKPADETRPPISKRNINFGDPLPLEYLSRGKDTSEKGFGEGEIRRLQDQLRERVRLKLHRNNLTNNESEQTKDTQSAVDENQGDDSVIIHKPCEVNDELRDVIERIDKLEKEVGELKMKDSRPGYQNVAPLLKSTVIILSIVVFVLGAAVVSD